LITCPFEVGATGKSSSLNCASPDPDVFFQSSDGVYLPLSQKSIQQGRWNPTLLQIRAPALDVDITQWDDRRQSEYPPSEIWRAKSYPTARGVISFRLGIMPDKRENSRSAFPEGTKEIRLTRLNKQDRPKVPLVQVRGEQARTISTVKSSLPKDGEVSPLLVKSSLTKIETPFLSGLDWVDPGEGAEFQNDLQPDACLLIVEAKESSAVANRVGVAYVWMMDFLVAGAEVKEILLR
jgi:hypothetical protein